MQKDFCCLPESSKALIRDIMEDRFEMLRKAIDVNYNYLGLAVSDYSQMFTWRTLVN